MTDRKLFYRSLRRVLAIFFLLSALLLIPVCRRDRALDRITELGGEIESPSSWVTRVIPWKWRTPLKEHFMPYADSVFGEGWVRRLEGTITVNLANSEVSDDDLKVLGNLRSVKYFILGGGNVSAEGLGYLERMTDLRNLGLSSMDMTDGQLSALDAFPNLSYLSLANTGISDVELTQLPELKNLQSLDLGSNPRLTGSGFGELQSAGNLTYLVLTSSGITDEGLAELAKCSNLETLILEDTRISDDGLAHLQGLTKLSSLYLDGTQVTQQGVENLRGLPIRILTLPKNGFDVSALKKMFPGCNPAIR